MIKKPVQGNLRVSRGRRVRERGQILIMVALAAVVMFGIVGLAIDVGRLYVARVELGRSLDVAALSGILELNGTPAGITAAENKAYAYFDLNEPVSAQVTRIAVASPTKNELTMDATKSVNLIFLSVLGIKTANVSAHAKAGFGTQYLDAAIVIDATGSMAGTDIANAKSASITFKNIMLGSTPQGNVTVGVTPFRGCFRKANPQTALAPMPNTSTNCVDYANETTYLSSNSGTLATRINNITAIGGSGTNVCGGLFMGQDILNGPNNHKNQTLYPGSKQYLILLSDGDNTYNSYSFKSTNPVSPYSACVPNTTPANSDGNVSTSCLAAQTREREIDVKAWTLAKAMKAANIEIFVVGFGVCTHSPAPVFTLAQCNAQIGNSDHDNTADERLLKCIASSTSGTNDHYFWASSSSELGAIFTAIANQIAHRLIE